MLSIVVNGFGLYARWRFKALTFNLVLIMIAEMMQTVPVGYTKVAKYNDAMGMLGNGWTVDVIAHIFSFLKGGEIFNNFSNENI